MVYSILYRKVVYGFSKKKLGQVKEPEFKDKAVNWGLCRWTWMDWTGCIQVRGEGRNSWPVRSATGGHGGMHGMACPTPGTQSVALSGLLYFTLELLTSVHGFDRARTLERVLRGLRDGTHLSPPVLHGPLVEELEPAGPQPHTVRPMPRQAPGTMCSHSFGNWYLCGRHWFCDCFYFPTLKYCFKVEFQLVLCYVVCPKLCFSIQLAWLLPLLK